MMKAALENYHARMRRVLDHIDRHLDADLDLSTLSGVAAFSKHHFQRQFSATYGLSAHRYVQLARMKRASYRLAFRDDADVTEIASDAGYERAGLFRPRLSGLRRASALGVPQISRLGAVARGLGAARPSQERKYDLFSE